MTDWTSSYQLMSVCAWGVVIGLIVLLIAPPRASGQETPIFERLIPFEDAQMLSFHAVLQDHDGLVWIGTDRGLHRYDGREVETYQYMPERDGALSGGAVHALHEDRDDNLWVGTSQGLSRFERHTATFTTYEPEASEALGVRMLYEDRESHLWMSTPSGMYRFHPGTGHFKHFPPTRSDVASLSMGVAFDMHEDQEGRLWIGTTRGLSLYDAQRDTLVHYHAHSRPVSAPSWTSTVYEDGAGRLWVTTAEGLYQFDTARRTFVPYTLPGSLPEAQAAKALQTKEGGYQVRVVHEDRAGILWVGANSSLYRFIPDEDAFEVYWSVPLSSASETAFAKHQQTGSTETVSQDRLADTPGAIETLHEDREGALWIGTGNGLYRLETSDERDTERVLTQPSRTLLLSYPETFWTVTPQGLRLMTRSRFTTFRDGPTSPSSLTSNTILSLLEDASGTLWAGTNQGLNWYRGDSSFASVYGGEEAPTLNGRRVYALAETADVLWIGTNQGLNRFERTTQRFTPLRGLPDDVSFLDHESINALHVAMTDPDGIVLWIGTNRGLVRYVPSSGAFTLFRHDPSDPQSLSHDGVTSIASRPDGTLWIGTRAGLNRLGAGSNQFATYFPDSKHTSSLLHSHVLTLYVDASGALWVGSPRGLSLYEDDRDAFVHYAHDPNRPHTLCGPTVLALHEESGPYQTDDGPLWVGTDKGLCSLDRITEAFAAYTTTHGLPGEVVTKIVADADKPGLLWIGTTEGIAHFDASTVPPSLVFGNQSEGRRSGGGLPLRPALVFVEPAHLLNALPNPDGPLELGRGRDGLTVRWAMPDYRGWDYQHAYRLEGFDHDWKHTGTQREAEYTNLPPGDYTLRIRSSTSSGTWTEAAFRLHASPPLWQRGWVLALGLLVIALILVSVSRKLVHVHRRKVDKQARQRMQELLKKSYPVTAITARLDENDEGTPEGALENRAAEAVHEAVLERGNIKVSDLADKMHVVPRTLQRHIKEVTGLTPRSFIDKIRIEYAKRLLLESDHSIGEIAHFLDYSKKRSFVKWFRRLCGMTPSEYRLHHKTTTRSSDA